MIHSNNLLPHSADDGDSAVSWEPSMDFLRYSICAILIGSVGFLILWFFFAPEQSNRGIGAVLLIIISSIAWFFLERGKNCLAVLLMTIGVWLIITGLAIFNGGVLTPVIAAYPLVILTAGWLIGPRAAWVAMIFSVAATTIFLWTEMAGTLPTALPSPPVLRGSVQLVIIVLSTFLVTFLVRVYQNRMIELRRASSALAARSAELEKSRAELHRAQGVANVGSWSYDITHDKMQLSAETCRIFGFSEDTKGNYDAYLTRVYKPDRSAVEQAWRLASKEGVFDNEHRIVIGKSIRWIRQKAEFEYGTDGRACSAIGITQDITERKRNDADLLAAKSIAETANNAKSRFLAAASHDLRQPIAALALYVGVLKKRVMPDELTLVRHIEECVNSLNVLLTDLLDISKLDAGAVTPSQSDFSIDDMLASLISVHSVEADIKGLRLHLRRSNMTVRTDQQLLRRMIGNLIVNAVHYTERGGVLVACRRHEGKCWIEVWDTGAGIPENKTTIIFEEFRQLGDDARNRGSGLGLAIVAKAAHLLGLQIRLSSRLGRGSMFAIEVPIGRTTETVEYTSSQTPVRRARIAIVEDNAQLLNALILVLETEGHEVIAAASGNALMKAPDVLISDYRLAEAQTGFDVIAMIRSGFGNELPAIIITGDTNPALVRSMADRGIAVHYKPLKMEVLNAFIRESTDRRRSEILM
jgi:signal transduction histidine kinase